MKVRWTQMTWSDDPSQLMSYKQAIDRQDCHGNPQECGDKPSEGKIPPSKTLAPSLHPI